MTQKKKHFRAYLPSIVGGLVLLGAIFFVVRFISNLDDKPAKREKKIQTVTLTQPPPPPPPPPKVEKPPEPEPEEKIEEQAEPEPDPEPLPDVADEPPPGDLGLDAEGTAGSDGFGLAARKGGKGLFGGGGGNPYAHYDRAISKQIKDILSENDALRESGDYTAIIKLWIDVDGTVKRFELARGSDNTDVDKLLVKLIGQYKRADEPPPPGMEQPIMLKLTSKI